MDQYPLDIGLYTHGIADKQCKLFRYIEKGEWCGTVNWKKKWE